MVGAVLCDLDGVLRRWPPMGDLDTGHGVPEGTLAAAAFAPHRLLPAITGRCTDEQWRAAVTADLRAHTPRAAELVAAWSAGAGEIDQDVAALLASVRGRVVLVTNATTRLESDVDALGLARQVDAVVNSARLGFAKPSPEIYLAAAEVAGVPPQRCLFVDDSAANVDAATALGMAGHHFTGAAGLRAVLASRRW
jgi:putative hydrolase of the HAD superfamily